MANLISFSDLESDRFGLSVFRGSIDAIDIGFLKEFYETNDPDLLILRTPVTEQANLFNLNNLDKDIIFADTLVYYKLDLIHYSPKELKNSRLMFKKASADDVPDLEKIIPVIFRDYTNHYFSNPSINREKIVDGYIEWSIGHIEAKGKVSFIVYEDDHIVAFATCSYTEHEAEGVLYGVMPEYAGRGIYSDIIRFTQSYFKQKNYAIMKVSTQIQNYAVQKVWIKEGFNISQAFITLHLNKRTGK